MRRSERMGLYATHALLRCILANTFALAALALAAAARAHLNAPGMMGAMILTLACLFWATIEATESVRLRRISRFERQHENQRAIRPKTENQTNQ